MNERLAPDNRFPIQIAPFQNGVAIISRPLSQWKRRQVITPFPLVFPEISTPEDPTAVRLDKITDINDAFYELCAVACLGCALYGVYQCTGLKINENKNWLAKSFKHRRLPCQKNHRHGNLDKRNRPFLRIRPFQTGAVIYQASLLPKPLITYDLKYDLSAQVKINAGYWSLCQGSCPTCPHYANQCEGLNMVNGNDNCYYQAQLDSHLHRYNREECAELLSQANCRPF